MTISLEYNFNSPDADIILLATELDRSTEFHVHKCILAAASPFFNDMFTLPQVEQFTGKLPVIPISESASVMDKLLRYIYPVKRPIIDDFDDICLVLGAAVKYDLVEAISSTRKLLISPQFLKASPIRVFAVACRYDLIEEAEIASRHTLNTNLLTGPPCTDLKYISAYEYHQLLHLHQERSKAALELLKIPSNIKCMQCNGSVFTMHDAPRWWYEFEKTAREELSARPTTDIIFGMEHLFKAARSSGCSRCPESVLDSWKFLQWLKESIDALPSTVSLEYDSDA